jgi:hypothetical protein
MNTSIAKMLLTCVVCVCFNAAMSGQGKALKIGIEFQAYPTGVIPGLRADLYFDDLSKAHVRIGYNVVRHGDAGEHQDERGGGPGLTIGYDVLPFVSHRWTLGLRTEFWFNEVDWIDTLPNDMMVTGTSRVTVLQPTLQGGIRLPMGVRFEFIPTLAFGYEFNIKTTGAEIGHGAILLAGIIVNYEL